MSIRLWCSIDYVSVAKNGTKTPTKPLLLANNIEKYVFYFVILLFLCCNTSPEEPTRKLEVNKNRIYKCTKYNH